MAPSDCSRSYCFHKQPEPDTKSIQAELFKLPLHIQINRQMQFHVIFLFIAIYFDKIISYYLEDYSILLICCLSFQVNTILWRYLHC
jgi:hypothetical protein